MTFVLKILLMKEYATSFFFTLQFNKIVALTRINKLEALLFFLKRNK